MAKRRLDVMTLAAVIAATVPMHAAMASGGGGGGGGMGSMPSMTAPDYDPAQEYQAGMAAYQAGKFKDAARSFGHVTEAAPKDARGWYMLGMARMAAGDPKGAKGPFEHSLKIEPAAIDVIGTTPSIWPSSASRTRPRPNWTSSRPAPRPAPTPARTPPT